MKELTLICDRCGKSMKDVDYRMEVIYSRPDHFFVPMQSVVSGRYDFCSNSCAIEAMQEWNNPPVGSE